MKSRMCGFIACPHRRQSDQKLIDPALIVSKFEEAIRLRSGLRRPPDVQDNEGRVYNVVCARNCQVEPSSGRSTLL
jgi:hypothetical protein